MYCPTRQLDFNFPSCPENDKNKLFETCGTLLIHVSYKAVAEVFVYGQPYFPCSNNKKLRCHISLFFQVLFLYFLLCSVSQKLKRYNVILQLVVFLVLLVHVLFFSINISSMYGTFSIFSLACEQAHVEAKGACGYAASTKSSSEAARRGSNFVLDQ